jgi:hypothetical protein
VCAGPGGSVVAVGTADVNGDYNVSIWRRSPAGAWAPGGAADGSFAGRQGQWAAGCAVTSSGFVVVGGDARDVGAGTDAAAWMSPDGRTWTQVADPDGALGGVAYEAATAVTPLPAGGVLVHVEDQEAGDADVRLVHLDARGRLTLVSQREDRLRGVGPQLVSDAAVLGDTVLLVGDDFGRAGLWESTELLERLPSAS